MHSRSGQSSHRDRTQEYLTVVESLKKAISSTPYGQGSVSVPKTEGPKSSVSIQSEFNRRASRIGLGIHQSSQSSLSWQNEIVMALPHLTSIEITVDILWLSLAKRTSVFDDPTAEIQELTAVIKQDITALNEAVVELQLLCNAQNQSGNLSKDTTSHSSKVVDDLKNRLMSTTKEFKEVLTMRTENLKVHENRRQLFSSTSKDASNPFIRQRPLVSKASSNSSVRRHHGQMNHLLVLHCFPGMSRFRKKTNGDSSLSTQPVLHHQQQQLVPVQDSYMQSRAEALQNVESTIHELSNIFTQLATMVSQQGELAIRIDENMDDTLANVEGAQGQLLKYLNSISSNRWLMIKIFFVLMMAHNPLPNASMALCSTHQFILAFNFI
ncbi:hypothetical protein HPP92_017781 [Vanilla planifolia]|uniref:t-SNARE coiled-coil homology domain-containing protein n=1 Tax=Vanilla planifolia TaxID=51239 RepID=A0A835QGR6_VANPL|nr:hypothetical protein HPP92_017781 [Vanilla planifolia]